MKNILIIEEVLTGETISMIKGTLEFLQRISDKINKHSLEYSCRIEEA